MRILLIEDSLSLRNSLSLGLEKLGHSVDLAATGPDGLSMALLGSYDIIVLDRMLPELDGMAILKTLRKRRVETKVLILSARAEPEEKVEGLLAGADDYLSKPFSFEELSARLLSLMRRGVTNCINDQITINGLILKYVLHSSSNTGRRGGTTQQMHAFVIWEGNIPFIGNRLFMNIPYSSVNLLESVANRQVASRWVSLNTPNVIFVLPMSIARSIL